MSYKLITKHKYSNIEYDKPIFRFFSNSDGVCEKGNRFCVVDGVTRDTVKGNTIGKHNFLESALTFPDLTKLKVMSALISIVFAYSKEEDICKLLNQINHNVARFNKKEIDYLGNDYFAFIAAGGIIGNEHLNFFNIGDSNIYLLNKNLEIVFKTIDDFTEREENRYTFLSEIGANKGWENSSVRRFYRQLCRNNEDVCIDGVPMSYGALTGEEKAMNFIRIYSQNLESVSYIACFTDGYLPYFNNPEIKEELIASINKDGKGIERKRIISEEGFGKERTLILYRRN